MNFAALAVVAVIELHADRVPTADKIVLEDPPTGFQWVTCVKDLEDTMLRCYIINPETMELKYADVRLKK